jgi:hypothetical protein
LCARTSSDFQKSGESLAIGSRASFTAWRPAHAGSGGNGVDSGSGEDFQPADRSLLRRTTCFWMATSALLTFAAAAGARRPTTIAATAIAPAGWRRR